MHRAGSGPRVLLEVNLVQVAALVDKARASCDCSPVSNPVVDGFGVRLKAGHQFLVLTIEVRILYPELL